MISKLVQKLLKELEAPVEARRFGTGWISGVIAVILGFVTLVSTICMLFPDIFTTPQLRSAYASIPVQLLVQGVMLLAFFLALLSLGLRAARTLGFSAIVFVLAANFIGGLHPYAPQLSGSRVFFGLDYFMLNVLFTGMLFVPLERHFSLHADQPLFRNEWREDLFYYFISSLMVQVLAFLSLLPSQEILAHSGWQSFRAAVGAQPFPLQFIEIMLLTDFMQYWVHRSFHRVPALWRFHAVHHSAKTLDWMAGARMHFFEIFILRSVTIIPMMTFGYTQTAIQAYILVVYLYSTYIHANIGWSSRFLSKFMVTPRFHHWHHGIEKEAIDVNFAIHFPLLDKLFGTYYLPEGKWPAGYGIGGHPVPQGYVQQFLYPFRRDKKA